jgi:hypothetical protein
MPCDETMLSEGPARFRVQTTWRRRHKKLRTGLDRHSSGPETQRRRRGSGEMRDARRVSRSTPSRNATAVLPASCPFARIRRSSLSRDAYTRSLYAGEPLARRFIDNNRRHGKFHQVKLDGVRASRIRYRVPTPTAVQKTTPHRRPYPRTHLGQIRPHGPIGVRPFFRGVCLAQVAGHTGRDDVTNSEPSCQPQYAIQRASEGEPSFNPGTSRPRLLPDRHEPAAVSHEPPETER